jgi:hypothetical protein
MLNFRREVDGKGISSYPHPWLMPDYWQFPTVSMGLGPIQAIYMARYLKYLHARGHADTANRKVWVFCGDGEMDEPESLGAIGLASREKLDNLIFIVNCNLQRLDGPVRGNGKIIQELEGDFRGAGWNVIKVIWGSYWDPLLARDKDGILKRVMEECVDGEYQNFKANDGAFVRKHFFGKHPKLLEAVSRMSDDDIWRLNRGGPRPAQDLRRLPRRGEPQGSADGHSGEDDQGLWLGQAGPGEEPDAPAEEGRYRDDSRDPRPLQHPGAGRQARGAAVLHSAAGFARDEVHARAQAGARRILPAAAQESRNGSGSAAAFDVRGGAERFGRGPRDFDHDGIRADPDCARAR